VTQFSQDKIYQFFVQGGKRIEMPESKIDGVTGNAVTPEFCTNQFKAFDDRDRWAEVGGFPQMNKALQGKWVLVMSLWDDVRFPYPGLAIVCANAFPSTTPTCSGSTRPTRPRRRARLVPPVATARRPPVSRPTSRASRALR
jgi:hypothetical protein